MSAASATRPRITIVVAIARNRVIGRDNDLPWRIPEDLARFKATTMGHVLVMGRRTYESIGRPLPGRRTVVVTRRSDWTPAPEHADAVTVRHSVRDALAIDTDELFVVGGSEIYREALPLTDRLLITEVDQRPEGDVSFPELDLADWRETEREPHEGFSFVTYVRR